MLDAAARGELGELTFLELDHDAVDHELARPGAGLPDLQESRP